MELRLKPIPALQRYELLDEHYVRAGGMDIYVPTGFRFDGASIPPAAWQLIYTPFNPVLMEPALVHDWLYHTHQCGSRLLADEIFHELLMRNGVDDMRRYAMFKAVRLGGESGWEQRTEECAEMRRLYHCHKDRPDVAKYGFPDFIRQEE